MDQGLISLIFFVILALLIGVSMLNLSGKYGKDSSIKMSYYTIDNALLINTIILPPGAVTINYSLDVSNYQFEVDEGYLVITSRKHGEAKYPLGLDSNVEITLNPGEKNYYHKRGDLFLSETKANKPLGLSCPIVNTTKINYKILFDPQDDFGYLIYNSIKSSNLYLLSGKEEIKSMEEKIETIKKIDHDIYLKISQVPSINNYVVAYVPFDNLNSTKLGCKILNSIGLYTDNILVVHSDVFEEFEFATTPVILEIHGEIEAFEVQKNIPVVMERYFK